MRSASVILDIPTKALSEPYTYLVPDRFDNIEVGCAVLVPFGNRRAVGFVVSLDEVDRAEDLKAIDNVVSDSYFDEIGAQGAQFISKYYVAPLSNCIKLFVPPGSVPRVKKSKDGSWNVERPQASKLDDTWIIKGDSFVDFEPRRNAYKQQAIIDALSHGEIKLSELRYLYSGIDSAVRALEKKGVIKLERRRRFRSIEKDISESFKVSDAYPLEMLTKGQLEALGAINKALDLSDGKTVLVDGVTGSGKTEVYLQAIERVLAEGKSAIVLVPEISLTPQTVARFEGRFKDLVAVIHSRMSQGERLDQWELIKRGDARVVVGARSALFSPVKDLGLIVIDEEHETTYKQESAPRYVSRDVASWMVRRRGATLVLGSATPSIEALHRTRIDDDWTHIRLPERTNGFPMPRVEVVDMASEFKEGNKKIFSRRFAEKIISELEHGNKVVLLLNQRGFAKFLLCRDCGFVPECKFCSTTLTYHERGNKLVCHHCGYTIGAPAVCPSCNSPFLRKFGVGTQRVEDELYALLAEYANKQMIEKNNLDDVEIIRMDADTTSKKGSHQRLLERFAEAGRAVLLGTQMIAKGLDFDDVTFVGVINADTQLHLPDFRSAERTFNLIDQVAGRAGRGKLDGCVMVQTYESDSVAIQAASKYDRESFLRSELPKRKVLGFPPFVRMANIIVWGRDAKLVKDHAIALQKDLEARFETTVGDEAEVLPASPCVIERVRGEYRWHIVVKSKVDVDLSKLLFDFERSRRVLTNMNVAIDVDPYDLL